MNHNPDNDAAYYVQLESKISDHLRNAENKLTVAGFIVTRNVRLDFLRNECFGLSVYGDSLYHLEEVRSIIGSGYKLVLNTNLTQILIK